MTSAVPHAVANRSEDFSRFSSIEAKACQVFSVCILTFTCVVGNCLVCYAVYRSTALRTVTNIFTVNLAVADLLVSLVVHPYWIITILWSAWPLPLPMCDFTAFMTVLLLLCSIFTLTGISLDRYLSICHPLRYPMEVTQKRAALILVWIWTQSALLASAPLLGWGLYRFQPQTIPICNPVWKAETSYATFLMVFAIFLPLLIMLFSYARVLQVARLQAKRIEQIQNQLQHPERGLNPPTSRTHHPVSRNLKSIKTVFIVVGAFFICWGPYVILNFWAVENDKVPIPYLADLLTTFLAFANSSMNPVIFTLLNRDFKKAVRGIFVALFCRRRKNVIFVGPEVSRVEIKRSDCNQFRGGNSGVEHNAGDNGRDMTLKLFLSDTSNLTPPARVV